MTRLLLILAAALLAACKPAPPTTTEPVVLVEVAPLVSLVQPLVAEGITVRPIVPAGVSPHGYQLTPSDAQALATASAVIKVGPTLDPVISRAIKRQTPESRTISLAALLDIEVDSGHDHSHDHAHDHSHDEVIDPHLWLDPELMARAVPLVHAAFIQSGIAQPADSESVAQVVETIESVDGFAQSSLTPFAGRAIITHHAAFQRLADRYSIIVADIIRPVETAEPTPGDLTRVAEAAGEYRVTAIFIEPQYPDALPRRIAERLGLSVLTLDPVGSEDWAELMQSNIDALALGLALGTTPSPEPDPEG